MRLQAERHTLTEVLRISRREISITFETATTDALRTVVPIGGRTLTPTRTLTLTLTLTLILALALTRARALRR